MTDFNQKTHDTDVGSHCLLYTSLWCRRYEEQNRYQRHAGVLPDQLCIRSKGASNWCGLWHFKLAVLSAGYLVVLYTLDRRDTEHSRLPLSLIHIYVYTTDFFVDVTEEVMETIRAAERAEAAYELSLIHI